MSFKISAPFAQTRFSVAAFLGFLALTVGSFAPVSPCRAALVVPADTLLKDVLIPVIDSPETAITLPAADSMTTKISRKIKARVAPLPIKGTSLILPTVLFGYGALAVKNGALQDLNIAIKREIWDKNPRTVSRYIEDYLILAPVLMTYALNIAGFKSHNNFLDRTLLFVISGGLAAGISGSIKQLKLEERPDGTGNMKSFPSGHTTTAFASAEYVRLEYRGISPWPGIAAYAFAGTAGFLRMYNNQHWFSDIVAGAGIGIFSARLAYYVYPSVKKILFGTRPLPAGMSFVPEWNAATQQGGIRFSYKF